MKQSMILFDDIRRAQKKELITVKSTDRDKSKEKLKLEGSTE